MLILKTVMMRRCKNGERGLSLIELMIVVLIIGILLSVVNTQYQTFYQGIATRGFASAVLAKAHEAKALSKALSAETALAIDLDNERVWIEVNGAPHGATLAPALPAVEINGFHDPDVAGTFVTTGTHRAIFTTEGTMRWGTTQLTSINGVVMHIGRRGSTYTLANAPAEEFRSLWFITVTGSPMLFQTGCVNSAAWQTFNGWPNCAAL